MGTNKVVTERREKVAKLTLRGFSAVAIAKSMNMTARTIHKDREINRKKWIEDFKKEPIEKALYYFMVVNDETFKVTWKVLENTSDERVKLECVRVLNKCLDTKLRILQSMGVIDQIPEKVELSGKITVQRILEISRQIKKEKAESDEKAGM